MGGKYFEIPSPALPGSGSKGMISARYFGHPRLRPIIAAKIDKKYASSMLMSSDFIELRSS